MFTTHFLAVVSSLFFDSVAVPAESHVAHLTMVRLYRFLGLDSEMLLLPGAPHLPPVHVH